MTCRKSGETYGDNKVNTSQSDADQKLDDVRHKVDEAFDYTFGPGTANMMAGHTEHTVGRAQMMLGDAAGDEALVIEGVKHEVRGTAERAVGQAQIDLANVQVQLGREIEALTSEMTRLEAEYAAATAVGEARANVQAKMDATKAKAQDAQARINAAIAEAQQKTDARIASMHQQAAQATGEAKAKIEGHISEKEHENEQFADYLNKLMVDNRIAL